MAFRARSCLTILACVAALTIASHESVAADLERTTAAAYDRFLETVAQAFVASEGGNIAFLQVPATAICGALTRCRNISNGEQECCSSSSTKPAASSQRSSRACRWLSFNIDNPSQSCSVIVLELRAREAFRF
jgi:hypothetical protein